MSYSVALFDLDGTVLDTLDDLCVATNHALESEGLPTHSKAAICSFVGNGIANLIDRAVPQGSSPELTARVFAAFKHYYAEHCADYTKPYDGIPELLATLRNAGVKTGLISNKADFAVQELVKAYFDGLFDFALGERAEIPRKPAPDMVYYALKRLGAAAAKAVFIGDSDVDVKTAKNAGLDGIFVTWGFRDELCLRAAGAERLANTPAELCSMLLENKKG